jgi:hypothetical protein
MKISLGLLLAAAVVSLLVGSTVYGQAVRSVRITPEKATLLVGDSRTFRLVDQTGRMQQDASWSVSDSSALEIRSGAELTVTAKAAGDFTVSAQSAGGSAEASLKVVEGTSLPNGTAKWSGVSFEGCKSVHVVPAVPSASGVDVYDQSVCPDGEYISAYTSDGTLAWRHKIGGSAAPPPQELTRNQPTTAPLNPSHLNYRAPSICDQASLGTTQQELEHLLKQRNLDPGSNLDGQQVWVIEESSVRCKLWFNEKSVLSKKQKILTND